MNDKSKTLQEGKTRVFFENPKHLDFFDSGIIYKKKKLKQIESSLLSKVVRAL